MPDADTPADPAARAGAELDAIEAAAKAATPGDWQAECIDEWSGPFFRYDGDTQVFVPGWDVSGPVRLGNYESGAWTEADAKHIAAARPEAVLALVARLRDAERERDTLRRAVRSAFDEFDRIKQAAAVAATGEKSAPSYTYSRKVGEAVRARHMKAAYDCAGRGMRKTLAVLALAPGGAGAPGEGEA